MSNNFNAKTSNVAFDVFLLAPMAFNVFPFVKQ